MNDIEFQELLNAEPPIVFNIIGRKIIFRLWVCWIAAFCIYSYRFYRVGAFSLNNGVSHDLILFLILFAGLLFFPSIISLILDRDGFKLTIFGKAQAFEWKNTSEFTIQKFFSTSRNQVSCDIMNKGKNSKFVFFFKVGDLDINQLAQLMNRWRERAIAAK